MSHEAAEGLIRRIHQELDDIEHSLERVNEGWQRARRSNDDYYLDSVALNLHGVYNGLERMFTQIAETIEGDLPTGNDWHMRLLMQMRSEITGVRPAVISTNTEDILDELRRFRHLVRNVYTHHLDPIRLGKLVKETSGMYSQLKAEILAFTAFLEQR